MPRILYGVSPIGLGHATRSSVLAESLRRSGAEVRLFSGGKAAEFLAAQGFEVDDIVDDAVPRVSNGEMSMVALWYVRSWLANGRNVRRAEKLFEEYRPDLVVCDEEFSGMIVASRRGNRRVFIADELDLGFARTWLARVIEGRVGRWYSKLQASVDLLIVPEVGEDVGNRRHVGPIVRRPTAGCDEVRKTYGLPEGRMVLVSLSGSGLGRELALAAVDAMKDEDGVSLVVTGNRGAQIREGRVFDLGIVQENQNLVACADIVVSTAGKSTIDEAKAAGTPVVAIPIRFHAEQERNAAALGYSRDDIHRLKEIVRNKIGRREAPQDFRGEETASRLILSLL